MFRRVFSRCFPGNAYVRGRHGNKILMRDLRVGQEVLTVGSDGNREYSEVSMMMHKQTNVTVADYVEITTESGQTVVLSSHHLIPIISESDSLTSNSKPNFVFSKNVRVSDYLISYSSTNQKMNKSRVVSVRQVTRVGAYAPLSHTGTLVVNDVYVSCYAMFPSHVISHYVFSVWRWLYRIFSPLAVTLTTTTTTTNIAGEGYHWYPNLFRTAVNWLPVLPYQM